MKEVIILLLMGYNNEVSVPHIKQEIETFYNVTVQVKTAPLPKSAYYKPRNRYKADSILSYLYKNYNGKRVVAITSVDVSIGTPDWGVIGLASMSNNVSITSTHRIKNKNLKSRFIKVVLHETGHTYNIGHCKSNNSKCFMNSAKHKAATIDKEEKYMCPNCKSKKKV